jgi:hypothetical protein
MRSRFAALTAVNAAIFAMRGEYGSKPARTLQWDRQLLPGKLTGIKAAVECRI